MELTADMGVAPRRQQVSRKRHSSGERTRASLLEAALLIWSRYGKSSVTMDAVAREAGRTRGIVYHHFSNRADLMAAASGHLHAQLLDLFANEGPTTADPYAFVAGLAVDSPELILTYIQHLASTDPRKDELLSSGVDRFRELAGEGRLVEGIDPRLAAIATIGLWFSAVVAVNLGQSPDVRRKQATAFAATYRVMMEQGLLRPARGPGLRRDMSEGANSA